MRVCLPPAEATEATQETPVWDGFTRAFHWSLVVLFAAAVATGKAGGQWISWHMRIGYAILALVLFRIIWGFVGGAYARFSSFLAGPIEGLRFARRLLSPVPTPVIGHNPVGGWMVCLMLIALAAQAVMGLFSNDEIATTGPLYRYVSEATSIRLMKWHRFLGDVLLILAGLHIAAVLFHVLVKREDILRAMVTGRKRLPEALAAQAMRAHARYPARLGLAWLVLSLSVAAVALAVNWPTLAK
ncbi:MAG: cytochrome b/b6 domain-containing protein [Casimicrobiaceae bacterium]|nr:cytochrome b/b6 domain-containing protein [Casimicrobiaceae bacterium]MCX8098296.1 cytochrome b/b6 domain-containing protein [Casimicrobiaceae bacterium]MDW8311767.1 cytochrome b/b6 domain-containing protein [Burkholderiales bacterium]